MEGKRTFGAWAVIYGVAGFFVLFAALPFAWMILTVFKDDSDLYVASNNPFIYNLPPTLENLSILFNETPYLTFVRNTLVIAVLVVIITVAAAVPAAYSLTRMA